MTADIEPYLCQIGSKNTPKEYEVDGYTDFLFYSKRGNLTNCANFNSALKVLVNNYNKSVKSDLRIDQISAHILRHTGCTRKAEDGMELKVIQYLMGHSSSKITNDVYNHVNVDRVEKIRLELVFWKPKWCKC
ncbi:tyrosine-type recombinase/integrase [Robinsoniella peoriensis]|uniref:tyrosine-type recombinase/integrase n=1 Tax=Robinsoniella peoriensis TaxID=180332 RepID=UPI003642F477